LGILAGQRLGAAMRRVVLYRRRNCEQNSGRNMLAKPFYQAIFLA
jgi:hypothetical protein